MSAVKKSKRDISNRFMQIAMSIAVIATALGMWSCGSSRDITTGNNVSTGLPGVVYNTPQGHFDDWQTLSVPVKIQLISPKKFSCSGRVVMVRGEETTVSMRVLGMEAGCIHFDRDSIMLYERLNHNMLVEGMEKITQYTTLDVEQLQNMMLGGKPVDDVLDIARNSLDKAEVDWSDIVETPCGPLPSKVRLSIGKDSMQFEAVFTYDYSKAKWNQAVTKFSPPDKGKYSVVTFSDALKKLRD